MERRRPGRLRRLPADRFDEATLDERFGPIRVFGEDVGEMEQAVDDVHPTRFAVGEEMTGRAA